MTFEEMGLADNIIKALNVQGITKPTRIQERVYNPAMSGRNVIGCSETGSGKTLAYILPLFAMLDLDDPHIQALIIVPTQELAIQVLRQIQLLTERSGVLLKSAQAVGDGNISRQIDAIKSKPQIIVGTTGRIMKLVKMKKLSLHNVKTLIIDEADKMMARDNIESLTQVRRTLMKYIQVMMFSATMNKKSIQLAESFSINPVIIRIKKESAIPDTIRHTYVIADCRRRIETLRGVINAVNPERAIIFVNTAYDLEETVKKLQFHHYKVAGLYGSDSKLQRKASMDGFKNGNIHFLAATDIASRGLQIDGIEAVINISLPENSTEYQHRAGRCGRNGRRGECISIVTENELPKLLSYQKEFGINIVRGKLYKGKLYKNCHREVL